MSSPRPESRHSATAFLRAAVDHFKHWGVPVQRVLTDNGMSFRSGLLGEARLGLGITQKFTRTCRPRTNGKAERFIQSALREWAYGRIDENSDQRRQALPAWTRSTAGIGRITASNLLTLHT